MTRVVCLCCVFRSNTHRTKIERQRFSWAELEDLRLFLYAEAHFSPASSINLSECALLSRAHPSAGQMWRSTMPIRQCDYCTGAPHNNRPVEPAALAHGSATKATMRDLEPGLRLQGCCRSCCPSMGNSCPDHEPSPKVFQRTWRYVQPASQAPTRCSHSSPGPPAPPKPPRPDSCRIDPPASKNSHLHARRPHRD